MGGNRVLHMKDTIYDINKKIHLVTCRHGKYYISKEKYFSKRSVKDSYECIHDIHIHTHIDRPSESFILGFHIMIHGGFNLLRVQYRQNISTIIPPH